MKIRDSGMPDDKIWASFFNVPFILSEMGINSSIHDLAEIGFGYGTFTIPAAQRISGTLYAFDIEQEMADVTSKKIRRRGINNVRLQIRDIVENGTGFKEGLVDYVMLFNILHLKNPEVLLNEAYRVLKPGGKAGIIHWRSDIPTPRGPDLSIRPTPQEIIEWAAELPFVLHKAPFILKHYHFGLIISKQ